MNSSFALGDSGGSSSDLSDGHRHGSSSSASTLAAAASAILFPAPTALKEDCILICVFGGLGITDLPSAIRVCRSWGSPLRREDFAAYRAGWVQPISTTYRGYEVVQLPPNTQGFAALQILNLLEGFDVASWGEGTADYYHHIVEAVKVAFADRDEWLTDPDFVDIPLDLLLDKGYAASLAAQITAGEISHVERLNEVPESQDTTHVCTLDADGNAVTMTHSLGMPSGVVTQGLGFMYNGCMSVFDPRPGRAGSLAPGKGRFTAMSPTIVFKGDEPHVIIGAPGGTFITMGVLQGLLNTLDFDMSISDAIAAPRFSTNSDTI